MLEPPDPPDVRAYVDGAALANLDEDGRFQLAPSVPATPYAIIDAATAREIAVGVISTWFANPHVVDLGDVGLAAGVEGQHGGPIDWESILPSKRLPYFAESHLEPLPVEAGDPRIRTYGPHYLVPFYEDAEWVVVVGVSAHATNVVVNESGFIRRTEPDGGGEFRATGISEELGGIQIPPSPERAVQFAFEETGVKTVEVPVLGTPGNYWERNGARWRLELANAVEFDRLADGVRVASSVVYVAAYPIGSDFELNDGWVPRAVGLRLMVADDEQPSTQDFGDEAYAIRPGYDVRIYEVTPVPQRGGSLLTSVSGLPR